MERRGKQAPMQRPTDVGILALEVYFPNQFCDQAELERHDGASAGKYTIGLGQSELGFCYSNEDVNSMALTVTQNLLERQRLDPGRIGFLEVGTETLVDKSKSTKTYLMQLLGDNRSVEGVDCKNACFGGTQALFHAANWLESSYWDGRLALVVCSDIAVYKEGPARCTGGAGAVAILLGPRAPLVLDSGVRALYMDHQFDFYKPDPCSEYATVDGRLSVLSYLTALDNCYRAYCGQLAAREGVDAASLKLPRFLCFHSPFSRLVQKSFGRLTFLDYLRRSGDASAANGRDSRYQQFSSLSLEESRSNKSLEAVCLKESEALFDRHVNPGLLLARRVGNMYTPSVYACLVSCLISCSASELANQRIALFSYGSGLASAMFSLTCTGDTERLAALIGSLSHVTDWLQQRRRVPPEEFHRTLNDKERLCTTKFAPENGAGSLRPGTFYLSRIDDCWRRFYERAAA